MHGLRELLQAATQLNSSGSSAFFRLFFHVLKLGSATLLNKFRALLDYLIEPKNIPRLDEAYLAQLKQNEK